MLYFVQTATFFDKSSMDELRKMARFSIIDQHLNNLIIETNSNLSKRIKQTDTTFVYSAFPMLAKSRITPDYLGSIYRMLMKTVKTSKIGKDEVVRIECYDINNRKGYSAKDLEVRFGRMLIKDGYNADLLNPERLVYMVLLNGVCYTGESKYSDLTVKVLNPLRSYSQTDHTSRAEMKLAEAFESFGIKGGGVAIDLGAAPGGWSKFLAMNGFKVIAADKAILDYKSLKAAGLKVVVDPKSLKKAIGEYDVVHVRLRASDLLKKTKGMRIDLIANDMNMDCKSSSTEVLRYVPLMKKGSTLIMTIKCMTRNAPRYMAQAKKILSPKFSIKGIKVLPVNRQEMTLYAIRK